MIDSDGYSSSDEDHDIKVQDEQSSVSYDSNVEGFIDSEDESRYQLQKTVRKINCLSVFYYEVDIEDELKNDFDDEELEKLSEDEINFNNDHLLDDNHNAISITHSNILYNQMNFLNKSMGEISTNIGDNFD